MSNANADPDALLAALHAERETAEQEAKRKAEEEEDEAELAKYFSRVKNAAGEDKGKGKAKAVDEDDTNADKEDGTDSDGEDSGLPGLTIKRRPAPGTGTSGEPTVATLLAAKGKILDGVTGSNGTTNGNGNGVSGVQQVKRKREGMQKLLGIKKKAKA